MHCFDEVDNIKKNTVQQIISGPAMQSIREHMAQGKWHNACRACKSSEEQSGSSGRTQRTMDEHTRQAIDNNINWFELQHLVINWSNLCNLSCTYCNPETSTAWQAVKKIPIAHVKNKHADLIELAKVQGHKIRGLTLGGGEPLLQKGLVEFLKLLNPQQVRVLVTTNLSVDLNSNPVYQELKNWPMVDWQVSFDNCTQEKFEYVRDRASWNQLVSNIDQLKSEGQLVIAHPAYSLYCALDLIEYYEFCTEKELNIYWCELRHPYDLDIRRYSAPVKKAAISQIDQVVERWGRNDVKQFSLAIDTLKRYKINLIDTHYVDQNNSYFADPFKYHEKIEKELDKSVTFSQAWPELTELLIDQHYAKR
jgi:organic radical activating enzyme